MINYGIVQNNKPEDVLKNNINNNKENNQNLSANQLVQTGQIVVTVQNQYGQSVKGSNGTYISSQTFTGTNGTSLKNDVNQVVNQIASSDKITTATFNGETLSLENIENKTFIDNQTNNINIVVNTPAQVNVDYQVNNGRLINGEVSSENEVTANGATVVIPKTLAARYSIKSISINGVTYSATLSNGKAIVTGKIAPTPDGVYTVVVDFENKPATKPAVKPEQKPENKPAAKPVANIPVVVKPVVVNNGSNPIVKIVNNSTTTANNSGIVNNSGSVINNSIPVVNTTNSNSAKIQGLPDTGLNANANDGAKAAGIAGLLSIIGLGFLLRKKK